MSRRPHQGDRAGSPIAEASDLGRLQAERLTSAPDLGTFCTNWLALHCGTTQGCLSGAVFALAPREEGAGEDGLQMVSRWTDPAGGVDFEGSSLRRLTAAAKASQMEGGGVLMDARFLERLGRTPGGSHFVAVPIEVEKKTWGLASLEIDGSPTQVLRGVLNDLQWSTGWFAWFLVKMRHGRSGQTLRRLQTTVEMLAATVGQERFHEAAIALVNEISSRFACDRVALGGYEGERVELIAISGTARLDRRAVVAENVSAAMEEALDQDTAIAWPPPPDQPAGQRRVLVAHEELGTGGPVPRAALTVPLRSKGPVGAITLERDADRPFTAEEQEVLDATAHLLGPVIDLHRREDRFIGAKVLESFQGFVGRFTGPGHPTAKLAAIVLGVLVLFFAVARWDYRVSSDCMVEAELLRSATAPFDGYIADARMRAGEPVKKGEVMAVLEDQDLQQMRLELMSREQELSRLQSRAVAEREVAQARIISSQVEQVRAQKGLIEDQVSRTRITSAIDGIIVSGDLSQHLGAPVEVGEVLFEVAPADAFRIVLQVDERDIGRIEEGLEGEFRLLSRPNETFPIRVARVIPLAQVMDGKNVFRVEAEVLESLPWLRPGMEGVAKVSTGRRLIIWIWTHRIVEFLRLKLWV